MFSLYQDIKQYIGKIDLDNLWSSFKPFRFALYDDKSVYLDGEVFDRDDRFYGNTAIDFNGEKIAIWNIELDNILDKSLITSKIIHEMFHAFQLTNKELRFPNEITHGLGYKYHALNLSIKDKENKLLAYLWDKFDNKLFKEFLQLRKYRQRHFPNEFSYETKIEVIEGMAEYIELKTLKELNFNLYQKTVDKFKEYIIDYHKLIPIRTISYHIGALILLICDKNNIDFNHEIGKTTATIYEIIASDILYQDLDVKEDREITRLVNKHNQEIKQKIDDFIEQSTTSFSGKFRICGFDPQNSLKYKDMIYCKYFVMYVNIDNNERSTINEECVLQVNNDNLIVCIYC